MKSIPSYRRREFLGRVLVLGAAGTMAATVPAPAMAPASRPPRKLMLQELTLNDFSPHLGSKFKLHMDSGRHLDIELVEATPLSMGGARPAHLSPRGAFSIIFFAPSEAELPQQIYRLEHEVLGELEIFLVPIGRAASGLKCEAIFN